MSTNPFDDDDFPSSTPQRRSATTRSKTNPTPPTAIRPTERDSKSQPPIFSARGVEWPLPPSLDPASYRKYRRASKALGSSIGISGCGLKLPSVEQVEGGESAGYGGLSGLMGRVLGGASTGAAGVSLSNDIEDEDLQMSATRPVLPPRAHCVSASNGWIVAAIECVHPPTGALPSSSTAGGSLQSPNKHGLSLTSLIPPLRLVSRWNVRRGTSLGSDGNQLIPLPPPVRANATSHEVTSVAAATDSNFGRILHTFVDPTGCHVLLSARNGEAYYLHSTSKKVKKLQGFGPNVDGSHSSYVPGVSLSDVAAGNGGDVQMGLTPGSYVTAVGWDRDRGTEGSTKRIILGTSLGELYEYALVSPNATTATSASAFPVNLRGGTGSTGENKAKSSAFDTKAGELGANDTEEPCENPVLLRRLNVTNDGSLGDGGAVGGILFHRVTGGIPGRSAMGKDAAVSGYVIVLASTGGLHKHTRLHTFRSEIGSTSLSLRSAFSHKAEGDGGGSLIELPGSLEFVDLHSCNSDYFALRTETGIYYGALERSAATVGGITDAGLLPYDVANAKKSGAVDMISSHSILSVGLTRHHFITLNSVNEVKFVNRVARKVIQQERVDWMSLSQSISTDEFGGGGVSELLMDIRRPDQIWLRKGRSLVHISSSHEDRDDWKYTLMKCIESTPGQGSVSPRVTPVADDASTSSAVLSTEEKQIDSQFDLAKTLCSNASQKAVVNAVRAEYYLSQGRAELAAKYFAQCPSTVMPFADCAARLALPMLGLEGSLYRSCSLKATTTLASSNMALITFLSEKLKTPQSKADSSIATMLGSWITELHMNERERNAINKTGQHSQSSTHHNSVNPALLHQFLSTHVRDMDARTIISVLSSHDISASECAGYSAASGDIGAAVDAALCGDDAKNGALDALRVLNDAPIDKAEHYYYKHALTLLSRAPLAAAKSFLNRYTEGLKETTLLPSFMQYERKRAQKSKAGEFSAISTRSLSVSDKVTRRTLEIETSRTHGGGEMEIKINSTSPTDLAAAPSLFVDEAEASVSYLEGVIKLGSKSTAVYNYLASLYANLDDEGPLFRFLSAHVPAAIDSSHSSAADLILKHADKENSTLLDLSYVLRTVLRTGRHMRSVIKLYMGFGMRQQAVELALKVDPSLARELARQSNDKNEKKRLWLMIARSAADSGSSRNGKDVVARVVNVLKDCGRDVLSIEDVLPFLPDFATIDEFKDEICQALSSYSSKIELYLKEMQECDQACDALREELGRLRSAETHVRADARCAFTNKYVLDEDEPFYAFPSGYVVTEGALKREVKPLLNPKQLNRVVAIENELSQLRKKHLNSLSSNSAQDNYAIEELQSELDGLIAAECPLTGSLMVNSIDQDFFDHV